tara:strand:- start:21751 stop:21930 length:180 start_codon:yes stop_codon:yes gene_type:complete
MGARLWGSQHRGRGEQASNRTSSDRTQSSGKGVIGPAEVFSLVGNLLEERGGLGHRDGR